MLDLAIGIVIGAAFTAIVNSLVKDLISPIIGLFGGQNFDYMFVVLKPGTKAAPPYLTLADAQTAGAVTLNYGSFISAIINFLIVALVLFLVVKAANRFRSKQVEEPKAVAVPPDVQLLTEIRDILSRRA